MVPGVAVWQTHRDSPLPEAVRLRHGTPLTSHQGISCGSERSDAGSTSRYTAGKTPKEAGLAPLRIGFGVPRAVGDPTHFPQPDHRMMLDYAQRAERAGFDSVWVPDHFFFETRPGVLDPYPEAWTLMTAIGATTARIQIASMVLAAGFRHPALLAKMAGALQELTGGRLLLGVGAGNQVAEHTAFGLGFDHRVRRFLRVPPDLEAAAGQRARHVPRQALRSHRRQPADAAPAGAADDRRAGRTHDGPRRPVRGRLEGGGAAHADGEPFLAWRLKTLQAACTAIGRDPGAIDISYTINVIVLPTEAATREVVDSLASTPPLRTAEEVRARLAIGTPDEVYARSRRSQAGG